MLKKKMVAVVFQVLITAFAILLCFNFSNNVLAQLPNLTQLNYNMSSGLSPYTIGDFEKLLGKVDKELISFCSEQKEFSIKEEIVTPVITNEWYFENYDTILHGRGFTEENLLSKDKVIVISDKLALKLFFNTEAVGKTLMLNNEVYTICGIYSESDLLINKLSSDGKQRVYIPYTSFEEYQNCEIDTISYSHQAFSAPIIEQMNLQQYNFTDFAEKAKVIKNFKHIMLLLVFIMSAVISLKIWHKQCRKYISEIRDNLKENYFAKSLLSIPLKYILFLINAIGIPLLLLMVLFVSDFSIYIVSKYIPYDNIFDVSYYLEMITENENLKNTLTLTGNTYLLNLYSNSFSVLIWFTIIYVILAIPIIAKIVSFVDKKIK